MQMDGEIVTPLFSARPAAGSAGPKRADERVKKCGIPFASSLLEKDH